MELRCVVNCGNILGEGAIWDEATSALWWVDIQGALLQSFTPSTGKVATHRLPERIGSFALRANGTGFICAFESGFALYDPATGSCDWIARPEKDMPRNIMNDGKCDRQGRFWAGSLNEDENAPTGALYRIGIDRSCTKIESGITVSNALCWSPDSRTMYYGDSVARTIWAYDFNAASGTASNRRVFATTAAPAVPDGATVDAEGFIWNAEWDGWCITRYAPDGRIDRVIDLPVQKVTSCAFGGPGLKTLYITSASRDLTPDQLAAQPLAGHLLALEPGVAGLPEARYRG